MNRHVTSAIIAIALVPLAAPAFGVERRTPVVRAVEAASPAVVNIYTETLVDTPFRPRLPFSNPLFEDIFPELFGGYRRPTRRRRSLGSGVIIDSNGTIVTNEHVIVRASTIHVLLADKREFEATLIGADSDFDLAVLKVEADAPLPRVPLPEDDSILIGETVIAIGNPYGLSHTVTVGVVSAVGRTIQIDDVVYRDFIQTDASINPGNSGGPLLNIEGRLLGINTAIYREAEGIGFAIPAVRVRNVVEQILHYGSVQPPWIGLRVQDLTPDLAFHFGVASDRGVLIAGVEDASPAAAVGLRPGQIIETIGREPVRSAAEFQRKIAAVTAGEVLHLTILDDGKSRRVDVRVGVLPAERIDAFAWTALGVEVSNVARGSGVVVQRVRRGSPAAEIGIAPGDVIAALGGREVGDLDQFRRRLAAVRTSRQVLVSVIRGRRLYRVPVPLEHG